MSARTPLGEHSKLYGIHLGNGFGIRGGARRLGGPQPPPAVGAVGQRCARRPDFLAADASIQRHRPQQTSRASKAERAPQSALHSLGDGPRNLSPLASPRRCRMLCAFALGHPRSRALRNPIHGCGSQRCIREHEPQCDAPLLSNAVPIPGIGLPRGRLVR